MAVAFIVMLCFLGGFVVGRQFITRQNWGEALVADAIANGFKRPHTLLNNVTFETENGTTQIDHLLVTDTGIFVIETKHYKGWIFGNPNGSHWTQVIFKTKSKFQNPLRQNYGHVKTIQSLFRLPDAAFFLVVVFTGEAEFKSDFGPNVFYLNDLIVYLSEDRPVVFDERKMAYIIGRIEMQRMRRSLETDEYHINSVRQCVQRANKKTGQRHFNE